ncbi:LptA/OstA family protein [Thermodesulfobacteriota bacterium]
MGPSANFCCYKRSLLCSGLLVLTAVIIYGLWIPKGMVLAADAPAENVEAKSEKIHITADRLIAYSESNYAEFIGNVRVLQGITEIESDRLKIFFKGNVGDSKATGTGEDTIEKIVATGNVTIRFENRVAVSEQAIYVTDSQTFTLLGPNSKVSSGQNFVSGEKITLHRADGRISVEGSEKEQVEAVFFPGEKGIN